MKTNNLGQSDRLAHLPVCSRRNLPVPYANVITVEDGPDFTQLDSAKTIQIARKRLCGICGLQLDYWIVFVGGPSSIKTRAFLDPPMHEDCAATALQLCPYMVVQHMERRKAISSGVTTPPGFTEEKPTHYVLYVTRSFKYTITRSGVIFQPAPAVRTERWSYIDGRLTRPGNDTDCPAQRPH